MFAVNLFRQKRTHKTHKQLKQQRRRLMDVWLGGLCLSVYLCQHFVSFPSFTGPLRAPSGTFWPKLFRYTSSRNSMISTFFFCRLYNQFFGNILSFVELQLWNSTFIFFFTATTSQKSVYIYASTLRSLIPYIYSIC